MKAKSQDEIQLEELKKHVNKCFYGSETQKKPKKQRKRKPKKYKFNDFDEEDSILYRKAHLENVKTFSHQECLFTLFNLLNQEPFY